jgi:THUMP domain-containing protein/RNA cap guanine-N2 methyltransferase
MADTAPTAWIDALLTVQGQALLEHLSVALAAGEDELRLSSRLRASHPPALVASAMTQVRLRERARAKFSNADRMYFTREGLEQASSERMARHHARRYAPYAGITELCTGIGGDLIGLAEGHAVLGVDKDPVHARLAALNAEQSGVGARVRVVVADVRDIALGDARAAFVDPARRSDDRRLRGGASEPPLAWCFGLAEQVEAVGIKAAPGLDTDLVPQGWEGEFVSEGRELKEAVLWSPAVATAPWRATVLPGEHTLVPDGGGAEELRAPGSYLLDADPAVTRAGLVETLARSLGACWKIDAHVGFLSADRAIETPFARTLAIEASMPWSLARLRDALRERHVGAVDIRKRGSAVDVDDLRRRLKLSGDRSATVVLTRVADRPWAFICAVRG